MKTTIYLFVGVLLLLLIGSVSSQVNSSKNTDLHQGAVTVSCAPDFYPMALQWASEYGSLNPEVKIEVIKVTDNSITQGEGDNISFVSDISKAAISNEANWKMVIGRNVTVPVINAGNPYLNELMKRGISQENFARIFNNPDKQNWGTLLANGQNEAMHLYLINEESVKTGVAKFLQSNQSPIAGITVGTKKEVISAIQNDPYAIGFCKVVDVMGLENQGLIENVRLLPIDKNGNGTVDYMEDIYSDANTFMRGVWIGKYPKTLYSNIYAVCKVQPTNETEIAFLSWVLTDGQQYMNSNGYCSLGNAESQAQLNKISTSIVSVSPVNDSTLPGLVLIIVAMVIILGLIISAGIRHYRKQVDIIPDLNDYPTGFDEESIDVPNGLYFDKSHTWAFMEKDGNISIGIDDFLQHITGPITRIEMKNNGEKIKKGDLLFSIIQSGKQLRLYSPVSGIIKKQNEALITKGYYMNSSPYAEGWVYRIEPANWFQEIKLLQMAEKHKRWLVTEFSRVKDFLAAALKPGSLQYNHVVLQDGGVLKEGVLSDFGPEVWEDFQTNFLDNYK